MAIATNLLLTARTVVPGTNQFQFGASSPDVPLHVNYISVVLSGTPDSDLSTISGISLDYLGVAPGETAPSPKSLRLAYELIRWAPCWVLAAVAAPSLDTASSALRLTIQWDTPAPSPNVINAALTMICNVSA